jgi:hypothetical protein
MLPVTRLRGLFRRLVTRSEPEEESQYRVVIGGLKVTGPDWGFDGKEVLFSSVLTATCRQS